MKCRQSGRGNSCRITNKLLFIAMHCQQQTIIYIKEIRRDFIFFTAKLHVMIFLEGCAVFIITGFLQLL